MHSIGLLEVAISKWSVYQYYSNDLILKLLHHTLINVSRKRKKFEVNKNVFVFHASIW